MDEVEAVDWLLDHHREIVENYKKIRAGKVLSSNNYFGLLFGKAMQRADGKLDALKLNREMMRRLDDRP